MLASVARAVGSENITEGLADAIDAQIEIGEEIAGFEGLPITSAAERSRYSTLEQQSRVLENIYAAASRSGDVDATNLTHIQNTLNQLTEGRRLTPDDLIRIQNILMIMEEDGTIEAADRIGYMESFGLGAMDEYGRDMEQRLMMAQAYSPAGGRL